MINDPEWIIKDEVLISIDKSEQGSRSDVKYVLVVLGFKDDVPVFATKCSVREFEFNLSFEVVMQFEGSSIKLDCCDGWVMGNLF